MASAATTPTATIHQFPSRPEARARLNRHRAQAHAASASIAPVIYDGGWYHEEAIEADRIRREGEGTVSH